MSAESILVNVLLGIGLNVISPQLTSNDYEIRQIRSLMNEAGKDISRRTQWSRMIMETTILGGIDGVSLPNDFHMLTEEDSVRLNKPGFHPVRPAVGSGLWRLLSGRPPIQPYYHLQARSIFFSPVLDDDGAVIRYVSKNWVEGKEEITQNGDNLLLPERLIEKGTIWRWKRQKGLPYDDILAEYEGDLVGEIEADRKQG